MNHFQILSSALFVESDLNTTAKQFFSWEKKIIDKWGEEYSTECTAISGSFSEMLDFLFPLTSMEIRRTVILETTGPWVGIFNNRYPLPDLAGPGSVLAMDLKTKSIRFTAVENTFEKKSGRGNLGAYQFQICVGYRVNQTNTLRYVGLINEGSSWKFYEEGIPLEFEDTARYLNKIKSSRLNKELIIKYLSFYGISPYLNNFYTGKGYLIELKGPIYEGMKIVGKG